jgi:hypothetical protein
VPALSELIAVLVTCEEASKGPNACSNQLLRRVFGKFGNRGKFKVKTVLGRPAKGQVLVPCFVPHEVLHGHF